MTKNKKSTTTRIGSFGTIALLIGLGTAFLLPAGSNGAELQDSVITNVPVMQCSSTASYEGVIEGIFLSPITSIIIDGSAIPSSQWVQSRFEISITMPPSTKKSFTVNLANGLEGRALVQQTLSCTDGVVVATESGGRLPNTATSNYNNLLGGVVITLVGGIGMLFRKRISTN
jgi:LPXTG-motif cell wall-anchored protein